MEALCVDNANTMYIQRSASRCVTVSCCMRLHYISCCAYTIFVLCCAYTIFLSMAIIMSLPVYVSVSVPMSVSTSVTASVSVSVSASPCLFVSMSVYVYLCVTRVYMSIYACDIKKVALSLNNATANFCANQQRFGCASSETQQRISSTR